MIRSKRYLILILAAGLILSCSFLLFAALVIPGVIHILSASPAMPDFAATIQAIMTASASSPITSTPTAINMPYGLNGKIVFTCQIYKYQSSEQICIINPDGSGFKRLTTEDNVRHFYPSLSPDGKSVVYSQYREDNIYEIYEMSLADGDVKRLTDRLGVLTGPEISPQGDMIVFTYWSVKSNKDGIWLMNRDGSNPRPFLDLSPAEAWDPTWGEGGYEILFASDVNGPVQLYWVSLAEPGLNRVTNLPAIRGRSDWSPDGKYIVTYSGQPWHREVYIMNRDGSNVRQLSPSGGDSQGPSFSPNGQWVTFTAYFDHPGDINGCEIYIIRVDGSDLHRLTNNDYCDYQPRWGP